MERIDAVTMDDMRALVDELWAPGGCPRPASARTRTRSARARRAASRAASPQGRMIRVAVAGAAGRMGATICAAVEGADDMELTGRADPSLGTSLGRRARRRRRAGRLHAARPGGRQRARCAAAAGVHVVIGTTGWDDDALREAVAGAPRQGLRRAQLRDRRGADDALRRRGVAADGARGDHRVPPRRQARRAVGHRRPHRRADGRATCRSTPCACRGSSPTRT